MICLFCRMATSLASTKNREIVIRVYITEDDIRKIRLIQPSSKELLIQMLEARLGLSNLVVQYFDKDFDGYVNVDSIEDVTDKCTLRVFQKSGRGTMAPISDQVVVPVAPFIPGQRHGEIISSGSVPGRPLAAQTGLSSQRASGSDTGRCLPSTSNEVTENQMNQEGATRDLGAETVARSTASINSMIPTGQTFLSALSGVLPGGPQLAPTEGCTVHTNSAVVWSKNQFNQTSSTVTSQSHFGVQASARPTNPFSQPNVISTFGRGSQLGQNYRPQFRPRYQLPNIQRQFVSLPLNQRHYSHFPRKPY